jgi:uncharacterized protein with HEPN domain
MLYIKGLSKYTFTSDTKTTDAVVRNIEIIGEAVKNLPDSLKKKYPNIDWKEIAGMRDVVAHEYFGIDTELVWKTAISDIPKLNRDITAILKKSEIK